MEEGKLFAQVEFFLTQTNMSLHTFTLAREKLAFCKAVLYYIILTLYAVALPLKFTLTFF